MRRQASQLQAPSRPTYGTGVFLGIIGYLVLSLRQPLAWSMPVWIALAFFAVPALVGFSVSRVPVVRAGAKAAYFSASTLMFLYTAINLMRTHARIASGTDAGQIFFVGVLVSAVYALIAGVVAASVYVLRAGRPVGGS